MIRSFFKKIVITALTLESRLVLWKYKPKIVAITGNAGKTSAKDAVFSVLETEYFTWRNEKSYNSDIGIPLTILHCKNAWSNPVLWLKNIIEGLVLIILPHKYPKWLILEVGADKPDDIGKFAKWLHPDIVIVTRIGETPVHVENFSSREELIREKEKLVKSLKADGILILNADDSDVASMERLVKTARVIKYGFGESGDIRALNYGIVYTNDREEKPEGINFFIEYGKDKFDIKIPGVIGRQNIYSALIAFTVGIVLKIKPNLILNAISTYERPAGRLHLINGIKDSLILDDTYNSSPAALRLAIESSDDLKTNGRKIAVLGDMLELGIQTASVHYAIGQIIPSVFDQLITVGPRSENFAKGAIAAGMNKKKIKSFNSSIDAADYLAGSIVSGDLLLVKGSQGMRMERVVVKLMAKPDERFKLVGRQEEEWLKR